MCYSIIIFIVLCVFILLFFSSMKKRHINKHTSKKDIEKLTNRWIERVVVDNDPNLINSMFCSDGSLVGTVSKEIRNKLDIKKYFNYFAKLPNITVVEKHYDISKVTDNVFINTAFITWQWDGQEPVTARMSFVFRNKCIFQLHSSVIPSLNEELYLISGRV